MIIGGHRGTLVPHTPPQTRKVSHSRSAGRSQCGFHFCQRWTEFCGCKKLTESCCCDPGLGINSAFLSTKLNWTPVSFFIELAKKWLKVFDSTDKLLHSNKMRGYNKQKRLLRGWRLCHLSFFSVCIRRPASFLRARTPVTASSPEVTACAASGLAAPLWAGSGWRPLGECHWST